MSIKDGVDQDEEGEAGGSESGGTDSSSGGRAPSAPMRAKPKTLDHARSQVRQDLDKTPISFETIRHRFTGFKIRLRRQGGMILGYVVSREELGGGQIFAASSLDEIFAFIGRYLKGGLDERLSITPPDCNFAADASQPTGRKTAEQEDSSPSTPVPQGSNKRP